MQKRLLMAAGLAAACSPVLAESPVVVTASRIAESVDDSLAAVTVITRDEIAARQAPSLLELLRLAAGVDLARTGGAGADTSLFLRGTNSNHVLVLVDGVRADSATSGAFAWQHLDPAQVERIEIVRGPRSSLYGSAAIGGVIQIFTRRAEGPTARVEAGSYGTYAVQAGTGGGDRVRYRVQASAKDSEGFDATNEDSFAPDPDDDGYRNRSLSAGLTLPVGTAELAVDGWLSRSETEYDQGRMDSANHTLSAALSGSLGAEWAYTVRAGQVVDAIETHDDFPARITARRTTAEWQNDLALGADHLLTAGIDHYRDAGENEDTATGATLFDESVNNTGAYLNLRSTLGANDWQLGARYDDHSAFGGRATGQVGWGRAVGPDLRLLASYGSAFKAPALNELYHPGFFGFYAGNPDLEPEISRSTELGLRYTPAPQQRFELNLFHTVVDELIAYAGVNGQAVNIAEARIQGLELAYHGTARAWDYSAALTLQQARNEADDEPLLRRPDEKLALTAHRRFATGGSLSAEVLYVGEREDFGVTLDAYTLLNLSGSYPLGRTMTLEGRIENLTDADYEMATGFETAGRSLFVALSYGH